jgi:hypothetical protein
MFTKLSHASLSPAAATADAFAIPLADVESEIFAETCDICGTCSSSWQDQGLCFECAGHLEDAIEYYTEDLAFASIHGKDAVRLLVLRQRADKCRDLIAAAAGSYDGNLELHEASVEEKILNKCATKCLARLPASFAPWWKDTWSHEKWCQVAAAREATVEKGAPIVQRLAAMFVAEKKKVHELKKAHAEALATVEARHQRELTEAVAERTAATAARVAATEAGHKREMAAQGAKYTEALAPLLGVRDNMRAECEKKCHDAHRKGYAMGYAFADQKWNPVYKAVCEELELVRKEADNHQAGYIRLLKERDELILAQADLRQELDEKLAATQKELSGWYERCVAAQNAADKLQDEVDAATKLFQAMRAENKELRQKAEEDKQMVQRHLKEIAKENAEMMAWETERLRKENNGLLELVNPTIKLMKSNPELFGGEALPSPRPPAILRLPQVKEEALLSPSLSCLLVESPPTVLPGIVDTEPCSSQTEGMCMALTEEQYKEMFGADRPPPLPPIVPDQPKVCGTAGCVDCPLAEPEPAAEPVEAEAKPKPNYNHPNWPSPITKRFAKHLAKHSGLRSPWHSHDPKSIKTHEDALEFIAKRVNISVENLLGWTMKQYQTTYDPWTLVKGPNAFQMGTAPATWWC